MNKNNKKLDNYLLLERTKNIILVVGIIVILFGLICLGGITEISPKRDLNIFNNLADTGLFHNTGIALIFVGALLLLTWHMISIKIKNLKK